MVADYAIKHPLQKILLTTTHENTSHLHKTICKLYGVQPENVSIMSWFSFLLTECVRPYQNFLYSDKRLKIFTSFRIYQLNLRVEQIQDTIIYRMIPIFSVIKCLISLIIVIWLLMG